MGRGEAEMRAQRTTAPAGGNMQAFFISIPTIHFPSISDPIPSSTTTPTSHTFHTQPNSTNTPPEQLEQTKVTGVEPVNKLQDGINSTIGGQLGQGGLGEGVGNTVSKEGVNRSERGGKDESGKII